jgi:tRNA dimethylallyltransferase
MTFSNHPLENILAIVGPTASGKSTLSIELFNAAKIKGIDLEIISMDSALVYRGMDIGTAKPSNDELSLIYHHGINIRNPWETYSAAQFAKDVIRWVGEIKARGNLPVIVGGTMLYWRALMQGLTDLPASTLEVRAEVASEAALVGWDEMYLKLQTIDPITASRLAPGDTQRVSRALEIYSMTGLPMSYFLEQQPYSSSRDTSSFKHLLISLEPENRSWLHKRIEKRFESMLENGFLNEVKNLLQNPLINNNLPSMRAVGYRQAIEHLSGEISFDKFIAKGMAASRQLAKRQLTWLRAMPSRTIIDPSSQSFVHQATITCLEHLIKFR